MDERNQDLNDIRARLGLGPLALSAKMEPGAVFIVDTLRRDEKPVVQFPEDELHRTETKHATRRSIVVQSKPLCAQDRLRTIWVVPCSSSARPGPLPAWEYELPEDEPAFTKDRVVAYPALAQPVLKSRLVEYTGFLSGTALGELRARIQLLFGPVGELVASSTGAPLKLPPR